MRVLWVLNLMPPAIGEKLGEECSVKEGWISGLLEQVVKEKAAEEISLGICYPVRTREEEKCREIRLGEKNILCYGFAEDSIHHKAHEELRMSKRFQQIFSDFQGDLLHLFGTEYGHCLAAAKAFNRPERILIGLQGIISECAKEYLADLPREVYSRNSFRDLLKRDGMVRQQEKFALRGEQEKEAMGLCRNVTGRTAFDQRAAYEINPRARYFSMNETLRKEFSNGRWEVNNCTPHRIFFSQADYPLKGFHYLLNSLPQIKKEFPDVTVAVAGNSLIRGEGLRERIKISGYGKYLKELIKKVGMEEKIIFLGKLSAEEMKAEYLKCHTYVCASSLENSPNSLGEAMCLGVPVVASDTGGIPSMLTNEKEGLLFPKGDEEALAQAVTRLWKDRELCARLSEAAAVRGRETHDGKRNFNRLLEIYGEICGCTQYVTSSPRVD